MKKQYKVYRVLRSINSEGDILKKGQTISEGRLLKMFEELPESQEIKYPCAHGRDAFGPCEDCENLEIVIQKEPESKPLIGCKTFYKKENCNCNRRKGEACSNCQPQKEECRVIKTPNTGIRGENCVHCGMAVYGVDLDEHERQECKHENAKEIQNELGVRIFECPNCPDYTITSSKKPQPKQRPSEWIGKREKEILLGESGLSREWVTDQAIIDFLDSHADIFNK